MEVAKPYDRLPDKKRYKNSRVVPVQRHNAAQNNVSISPLRTLPRCL